MDKTDKAKTENKWRRTEKTNHRMKAKQLTDRMHEKTETQTQQFVLKSNAKC